MDITEEYEDVLQNLEFPIMNTYRQHPELEDWEVKRAIEAVIEHYRAEYAQRKPKDKHLSAIEQQITDNLVNICEWRLGRVEMGSVLGMTQGFTYQVNQSQSFLKTPEELQKCLKRIVKSVERWDRVGGRQGYLNFASRFI